MTETRHSIVERPHERGSALIAVLLLLLMMSALAAALSVSGQTETLITRNQQAEAQAQAAAEAGLNHATELVTTYIFEWKANGFGAAEEAIDFILFGPDQNSGTEDDGSLDEQAGISAAEAIPLGTQLSITDGIDARHEAFVMDDDATAPDEDGDLLHDVNQTLVIRATGYARDNTKVVLEALIVPLALPAVVTNGDLTISGNVAIMGTAGSVHSNGDLTISGSVEVTGTATASGDYDGTDDIVGSGGNPPFPIPGISAADYLSYADFILTSTGTMTNPAGTVQCTWSTKTPCNNWDFNSVTGAWSIGSAAPTTGTYYVQGAVNVTGSPGSSKAPVQISIIATGSINISGSPDVIPDTPELLLVTDGDLEISGGLDTGDPLTTQGQILVHEQIKLSGNPALGGQLIVEDAATVSTLVTENAVRGNVDITYNGGLGGGIFKVGGWRDIRDDD